MYDQATIGARLRMLRKWRKLSLVELADLAGMSKSYLSMAERGERALDRRSYIAALADALQVSETELVGGPHLTKDPAQSAPHAMIPQLRAALIANTLTAPLADRARPLPELLAEMDRLDHSKYKFREVGRPLPAIIDELHVHAAAPAGEAEHRLALEGLIEAFQMATFTTKDLGYGDLSHIAAMRAGEVAAILGDPVNRGKADSLRIHTMPATTWRVRLTAAEQAVDRLQPHVRDDTGVHVLGMLTLAASMAATVAADASRARHWLDHAAELAGRTADAPGANWGAFSTTNVNVWRISLAVEQGESGGVLELARRVEEHRLAERSGRHTAFLTDVGRGLARDPRARERAVEWLHRAENVAPHKFRNDAKARETVGVLLQQVRSTAAGRVLRGMAARMGLPH
ncbi:helix-turn-helix domain-containing protein [Spongiactinospora gelatinilytica]|nr:helix-turn-helix transcriptional regulator [Spongiactinospora gelatinilytica]